MNISERIGCLRDRMKEKGITYYLIPSDDYHQSEYVSDYFKAREFITGFTGSAGTALIGLEEAVLWTDGRYYIQAEKELQGSGIILYRSGMDGVPTVREHLAAILTSEDVLGFDGRVVDAGMGCELLAIAKKNDATIETGIDFIGEIWKNRPAFPVNGAFVLEEKYAGQSVKEKLQKVRDKMSEMQVNYHVLSEVCDIAWLLNVRGYDISHVPVILSYVIMDGDNCTWYVEKGNLNESVCGYLKENNIVVKDYDMFYADLSQLEKGKILADKNKMNYRMQEIMGENMVDGENPETIMKAVKNPVEIENIKKAHIKDGVVVTKFMYWLKQNIGKRKLTEVDAADYINKLRAELPGYVDLSFDTIAAYGENAAMMHYQPGKNSNAVLKPEGFLLVDSGGHYLEGSTDITRTFALGSLSREEKQMFTAVLRGNLNLADAKFLYGCTGRNLDILARQPLWQQGVDYRCGTGHGNGYLLNVHEGPNAFRWRASVDGRKEHALEEGMITTDEPGVYVEGKYGIRIENELLCKKGVQNEYGQFMEFETITYAPIDLDAVLPEEMTVKERQLLNEYHKMVYNIVAPHLIEDERRWLKEYTKEI